MACDRTDTQRMRTYMTIRSLLLPAALIAIAASCDSALDVKPTSEVDEAAAIVDAQSARAALAGAYDALQEDYYYQEAFITINELLSDNAIHTGTFTSYVEADDNLLTAQNDHAEGHWEDVYLGINRANILIQKIPSVPGLTDAEKNQIIGEALFLRALHYHNLVKEYGGVPLRLEPVANIVDAGNIARATVADVYAQILADLTQAEALMTVQRQTRAGSIGGVRALRARVLLYQASPGPTGMNTGNWAGVEAAATTMLGMTGYALTPVYADLFSPTGGNTSEDIFRVRFTDQDANSIGYYYTVKSLGGRYEVGPSADIRNAYEAGDVRRTWSIKTDPNRGTRFYVSKFPTVAGTEHPHVIRLAEVYLIRAEARAMQNNLAGAVADYNLIRARAGLAQHVLGVNVVTQADVIAAIQRERRVELAFEGDRWPDLVRSNRAVAVMGLQDRPYQVLYPIPQSERDVTTPPLEQNPGY
jgi:starch-binding outer membrane protein, SusD/RagB family